MNEPRAASPTFQYGNLFNPGTKEASLRFIASVTRDFASYGFPEIRRGRSYGMARELARLISSWTRMICVPGSITN